MEDNNFLDSNSDEEINVKDQNLETAREENNKMLEFFEILQKDDHKPEDATNIFSHDEENEELVSLSLGLTFKGCKPNKDNIEIEKGEDDEDMDKGSSTLALGLDINLVPVDDDELASNNSITAESSFGHEEPSEMWPPSKVLKTMKSVDKSTEAYSQHDIHQVKKTRVSIRARCDTQTMNDGCQWRKYGQKMAKGNPCPRAYYRCTTSPSCPVRKQVQRCAEDMTILITTYEGTHNHPLPTSATAIACTTSAAASMLQSPSLSSQHGLVNSAISSIINSSAAYNYIPNNNALNFSIYQVSRPHQFYFSNSSISTMNSHPTITLDLTTPSSNSSLTNCMPKYSSTNLSFSPLHSTSMPQTPWSSTNYSGYFNSGGTVLSQNRNHGGYNNLLNTGNQNQPPYSLGHLYMSNTNNFSQQKSLPADPIAAAATKAITSNPKFQSALATALTTYVGNDGNRLRENHVLESADQLNLKLCSENNSIGCASSSRYLNMSSSLL